MKRVPTIQLPDLFEENKILSLSNDRLTLIDFWEVWCRPCIQSLPNVEEITNKFKNDLRVIGIVSQKLDKARALVNIKETTFQNLAGNFKFNKTFNLDSWSRYFLVDENGILQKEHFQFSDQIEEDIQEILSR